MLRGIISEHFSSIGSAVSEELGNKQREIYHCFSEKDNKIFYLKELIKLFRVWLVFDD